MTQLGTRCFPLLLLLLDCAPQSRGLGEYEEALVEPSGAYNLVQGSQNGTQHISYQLDEPYPAEQFLDWLTHRLTGLGWTASHDSSFNPGSPNSHVLGWSDFEDGTVSPSVRVDQWMADWTNADGAVLSYVLKYSSSLHGASIRDNLSVRAIVMSPQAVQAFQNKAATLEEEANRVLAVERQASRTQDQRDAAALREGATSVGRVRLRLLDDSTHGDPGGVSPVSFDEQVPPLELDVVHANVEPDGPSRTTIRLVFSEASAQDLHKFSSAYLERTAAVIVDEEVVATPFIASSVSDIMIIHGSFTQSGANEIVDRIMN